MFRLVRSRCPSRFGNPKGNTLRILSAPGFNPAIEDEGRRSRFAPIAGAFGGGTVSKVHIGGFITNAFGDGASVSPREVQIHALNWCSAVSMPGTLKSRA